MSARTPLLVGMVVIVGLGAFLYAFGSLDQGVEMEGSYEVYAVFDDASGLVAQSRVMLSGIPVGQIQTVELDPDNPAQARITLLMRGGIELFQGIRDPETGVWVNGASAQRRQASLLGDYYISLSPGVAGEVIQPGGEIQNTVTESGIGAVIKQFETSTAVIFPRLEKITDDVSVVTSSLREAVGGEEGLESLKKIRTNVASTAEDIAGMSSDLRGFVNTEVLSRGDEVGELVGNVVKASQQLAEASDRINRQLAVVLDNAEEISTNLREFVDHQVDEQAYSRAGTISHTLARLDESISVLQDTLETGKAVASRIEQGEGTVGRLLTDDKLVDDAEQVMEDVKDFTSRFGRLQVNVDLRSEYQMRSAMKHYVSFGLYPRPDKYYFFQVISDPQGLSSFQRSVVTSNDPNSPPLLVEDTVFTEDTLKFTAQFAKRWHFLTFRYGLMESTGGFGVDLDFMDDTMRVKTDVFDWSRAQFPRLRVQAAWEFMKHLYVSGGVDDAINASQRDYFVGVGVTFTDGDIKALLPMMPNPL
ncbi:MAG: MlaD family protein [Myxococcota bacterium]|nr:MlaD family protein [Myxococcota bacterium]